MCPLKGGIPLIGVFQRRGSTLAGKNTQFKILRRTQREQTTVNVPFSAFCSYEFSSWIVISVPLDKLNLVSLLKITFANKIGKFDLEVTTFQMAVLFAWNERPHEKIAFENLRSVW